MNIFSEENKLILQKMFDKQVDFMLVGGHAVIYHGYNRLTGDMDIWLKPDNNNKKLLLEALTEIGFDDRGIAIINNWDFTNPQIFHIGKVPDKTEFMTSISGVEYDSAKQNAVMAILDGVSMYIIHLNDLIENKKASGRLKDLADVEHLQKVFNLRNQK